MTPIYKFMLPIGDWAGDGHEKCEYFMIESNKPVEEVREAHFRIKEATGIDIENICSAFEEDSITEEEYECLTKMGFTPSNLFGDKLVLSVADMADLWLFLLEKADPTLDLHIIEEEDLPLLSFYGYDGKGRHIGTVGYGVF